MPEPNPTYHRLYTRSFFAESIPAAMEEARQQMGPDALLLESREAPPEARHLGAYEVIFAGSPQAGAAAAVPAAHAIPEDLRDRLDEIRTLVAQIGRTAPRHRAADDEANGPEGTVERVLTTAGLPKDQAREIAEGVRQRIGRKTVLEFGRGWGGASANDVTELMAHTAEEITARLEVRPEIGRISAFIGAPGAGKTSTAVKLAIRQGLALRQPVRLISVDTLRIGAADQLRTYASILGVPFEAVETTAALAYAIQSAPAQSRILIDTPGFTASMLAEFGGDLAAFLAGRQDIDTHLVLTAAMRPQDAGAIADRFAPFRPAALLFTRLDETTSTASIASQAIRLRLPLSFFCAGPSVPEDLEPATARRITDALVSQLPNELQAVA